MNLFSPKKHDVLCTSMKGVKEEKNVCRDLFVKWSVEIKFVLTGMAGGRGARYPGAMDIDTKRLHRGTAVSIIKNRRLTCAHTYLHLQLE